MTVTAQPLEKRAIALAFRQSNTRATRNSPQTVSRTPGAISLRACHFILKRQACARRAKEATRCGTTLATRPSAFAAAYTDLPKGRNNKWLRGLRGLRAYPPGERGWQPG